MRDKMFYILLGGAVGVLAVILFYAQPNSNGESNLIKVGYNTGNIDYSPFFVADNQGFFTKRNITIEKVPLTSGHEVKLALSTGQLNVAFSGITYFFVPISKGIPLKMIAPMGAVPTYLYVRPASGIKTFQDLKGKTISVTPGGSSDYYMRYVLKQENISANEVNLIQIDKANRPIALMDKKVIDAVPVGEEELAQYIKIGAVPMEEWDTKGYSSQQTPETFIGINEDYKTANPGVIERFLDAMIDGHKFIKSNPQKSAQIVSAYIKDESEGAFEYIPEDITAIWKTNKLKYYLWYDPTSLTDMSKIAVEIGQIESELTLDQFFDLSFKAKLQKAQNEIYPVT